jgi:hypothetical protein
VLKSVQCGLEAVQSLGIDVLAAGNVCCIQECRNALDNVIWDISYDRGEKYLDAFKPRLK